MSSAMTEHENLLHHIALSIPALPFHEASHIALVVRAWLKASRDQALDASARIDEGRDDPNELLEKFVALGQTWGLDPSITVSAEDLVRVVGAVLSLEGTLLGDSWSADPAQWAVNPDSTEVILAPWVADLMALISTAQKPSEVYLPFETVGQLACRVASRGAIVAVESRTPHRVQLGLVTSGSYGQSVHYTDPVIGPCFSWESQLKQFPAATAVIPLRETYLKEDLGRDIYHRFDHSSARGPLAAIFQIIAQTQGRAVILVPDSVLFKPGAEHGLRAYFMARQCLEAIIGLPASVVQGLKGSCSIVVLNTAKTFEQILFVRATPELLMTTGTSTPKIHQLGLLIRNREEGRFSSLVNVSELLTDDLNMEASRHVTENVATNHQYHNEFTSISEHFDLIRPRQHSMGLSGAPAEELQAQDIPAFGLVRHATKATVHDMDGPNAYDYFLRPGDVLICIKGATGKVGFISKAPLPGAGGWVAGQSVAVLRARGKGYLPQALMMYLRSPFGQAGLRRLVVGTSAPTIQAKALRKFQIPVLTAVQADMALEALEEEATIERQIDGLRQKQANISSFLWPI
ncbi:N-6 DNA methylase [Pseudomonas syringae group genomosp. 3]|uniref:N-6 DNA methylase n=1 Tax=Pseudomonas syringae group genomosp. 3 TaxID=251701 RepID=UPI0006B94A52|nr:N-6 DNA methylase [Pseudomonas syringae group genomosp. 3]MBM0212812.1 N-6 DNA methylase [Pseudomonas syringae pv. maculicola]